MRHLVSAGCLRRLLVVAAMLLASPAWSMACGQHWPLWQRFADRHMEPGGRVVDFHTPRLHSTSEGQSYAMFFALVANDRERFDRLWQWSQTHLMRQGAGNGLPAWQWGRRDDGTWGVVDPNSASDADLWFAYALLEASRLWREPRYGEDAKRLLEAIRAHEVVGLPGRGPMLLPGAFGFVAADGVWRLNPSYLPVPVLRRLAAAEPGGPWAAMADLVPAMILEPGSKGFAADWVQFTRSGEGGRFEVDRVTGDLGSYDAIRCYLWAGMMPATDPLSGTLLRALRGMQATRASAPPEKVRISSGVAEGTAPPSFQAALLPYRAAVDGGDPERVKRVAALFSGSAMAAKDLSYYDYVLGLFGLGWADQRFGFDASGALLTRWEHGCRK